VKSDEAAERPSVVNDSDRVAAVSVVVLTRNRAPLLKRCLSALHAQQPPPKEIIVVDNGSTDDSVAVIRSEFPSVRIIANRENLGIAGRNKGFRVARQEIVLSLDDDIELKDPETLSRILRAFERRPSLGAVTLKLCEEASGSEFVSHHWWHPMPRDSFQDREFETEQISEAAVAFRAEALEKAGYYDEALFWGGEGLDLVLGIMEAGYSIWYLPLAVMHLAPRGNINYKADYRHALLVRNRFWIVLRRLGPLDAFLYIAPRLLFWFIRSIRYGYLNYYLRGIADLGRKLPEIPDTRRPISAETRRRLRRIRGEGRRWSRKASEEQLS
jgi:GT2 family glycosyltransferase